MKIRCLFDNASNVSLLREDIAKALGLEGSQVELKFTSSGGENHKYKNQQECWFQLMSLDEEFITPVIQAGSLPVITANFQPLELEVKKYAHLKGISDFTEDYSRKNRKFGDIELLLGIPYQCHYTIGRTIGRNLEEPIAIHTSFGSLVSAKLEAQPGSMSTQLEETEFESMAEEQIAKWMSLEPIGISDSPELNNDMTWAENTCKEMIVRNTEYVDNKYYRTVLPWKSKPIQETNQARALAATVSWVKRLEQKNPKLLDQWIECFQDGLDKKLYTPVPAKDLEKTADFHYISTFPVVKEESQTHKVRLVFAANQKMAQSSKSLNDHLWTGPNQLQDLVHLLVKFRSSRYVLAMDISRMFFRFALGPEDQDFLRFFLVNRRPNGKISYESFRCSGLPFGLNSSVFTATFLMQQHARKYLNQEEYKLGAQAIIGHSYMDDLLIPGETKESLFDKTSKVREILNQASLPTYKFVSNSKEVLEKFPVEVRSGKTVVSLLGIVWDSERDLLTMKMIKPPEEKIEDEEAPESNETKSAAKNRYETGFTKRTLLSAIARIFDSQGYISPYVLQAKLIMQSAWLRKKSWDETLDDDLLEKFKGFLEELPLLEEVTIPRCLLGEPNAKVTEIAVFCDASAAAYSCVVYTVSTAPCGKRYAALTYSKSRVRPLGKRMQKLSQELSIVRMELLACYLASIYGNYIRKAFPEDQDIKMRYFSDSQVTLYRINHDYTVYKPFVANRLKQIKETTNEEDWYYVETELNVSDAPSHGKPLGEFVKSKEWWEGPSFLVSKTDYTDMSIKSIQLKKNELEREKEERKQPKTTAVRTFSNQLMLMDPVDATTINKDFNEFWNSQNSADPKNSGILHRFHSWSKLLRVTARVLQFIQACKKGWKNKEKDKPEECKLKLRMDETEKNRATLNHEDNLLKIEQLEVAQKFLFRLAQYMELGDEVEQLKTQKNVSRTSKIYRLRPVWDTVDNLVRMTGRAPSTSLILLPKYGRVSELFVHHVHRYHNHLGTSALMTRVENSDAYLIGGRNAYKRITQCCICRPPRQLHQEIAELPIERIATSTKSFLFVALDYLGPFKLRKQHGAGEHKVWGMIASCLVTRFIHVELVSSCSTSAFLAAFRSFVALRGQPRRIWSDNATYFKSGDKQLKSILREVSWKEVANSTKQIDWQWFCPLASSKAGIIESSVKVFKQSLEKALNFAYKTKKTPRKMDIEQFRVVVLEVTAIVNDRPLAVITDDKEGLSDTVFVTPNQLVYGRNARILPVGMKDVTAEDEDVTELYKIRSKIMRIFFKEYMTQYQRTLKFSKRFFESMDGDIPVGTLVLTSASSFKPGKYTVGRVTNVHRRANGKISRLEVQTTENRNPVYRDLRQCSLLEHQYLSLISPVHRCLINGFSEENKRQEIEVQVPAAILTLICN